MSTFVHALIKVIDNFTEYPKEKIIGMFASEEDAHAEMRAHVQAEEEQFSEWSRTIAATNASREKNEAERHDELVRALTEIGREEMIPPKPEFRKTPNDRAAYDSQGPRITFYVATHIVRPSSR